ncbi:hypothetical protein SAMD00019534_095760 [Acytostelium subglobosum LB1]|uniref:hypothetical protein n=1 Tax=Acytostelium subglobosum LB1 TaxID=1410327 RepID=UPI000644DCDA|nr:hypothetical protein SAMD00019534_095760 [Acytostelium subglobosum LB1]GAM26401.1 hypothetical protein SAMD00019534_095760 [Acytostelium subglobosum LB1]|eukprot:XP_012750497.1 hypothetical protein SAMD00019534_095760 [Acytostelium subglobosum LB1]
MKLSNNAVIASILLMLLCIANQHAYAIFEEQIGVRDWRLTNIGLVKAAHIVKSLNQPSILIQSTVPSTLESGVNTQVLSLLHLETGSLLWRQILPAQERSLESVTLDKTSNSFITVSGGNVVRLWSMAKGSLLWTNTLTNEDGANVQCTQASFSDKDLDVHVICQQRHYKLSPKTGSVQTVSRLKGANNDLVMLSYNNGKLYSVTKNDLIVSAGAIERSTSLNTNNGHVSSKFLLSDSLLVLLSTSGKTHTLHVGSVAGESINLVSHTVSTTTAVDDGDVELISTYSDNRFAIRVNNVVELYQLVDNDKVISIGSYNGAAASSTSTYALCSAAATSGDNYTINEPSTKTTTATTLNAKSNGEPRLLFVNDKYSVVVTADWSVTAYKGAQLLWTREESLAAIVQSEILDAPVDASTLSQLEYEFEETAKDSMLNHIYRRLETQLMSLIRSEPSSTAQTDADRDARFTATWNRDVDKLLLVATKAGKVFCLHTSERGAITWSLYYPTSSVGHSIQLFITGRHLPDLEAVVVYSGVDKRSFVSTVDILKGAETSNKAYQQEILHSSVIPYRHLLSLDEASASNDTTKAALPENLFMAVINYPQGQPPMAMVRPWTSAIRSNWELLKHVHFYLADKASSVIRGYSIESIADGKGGGFKTNENWVVNFGASQRIVTIASSNPHEVIGSPAFVLGNRNLLPKYINKNLISVACMDSKTQFLSIYLIDSVSGEIIKQFVNRNAGGKVSIVHIENSVIYSFFDVSLHKQIIASIDIFEGSVDWKKTVFSSYDSNQDLIILQKTFVFPFIIQTLSESISKKGITSKFVLVGLASGQILPIDKKWIDSRRPYPSEASPFDQEEGLIPYSPNLNFPHFLYITYNTTIPMLQSISTQGTFKESTSLVVANGIDLFCALISPSSAYDVLTESFDHFALIGTTLLLAGLTYITSKLKKNRLLTRKWK